MRYLSKRLDHIKVVDSVPTDRTAVYFGAWVWFEAVDDEREHRVRIVGPDETDATLGWISIDSPLARAALKKRVDDEFDADSPTGRIRFLDRRGRLRRAGVGAMCTSRPAQCRRTRSRRTRRSYRSTRP